MSELHGVFAGIGLRRFLKKKDYCTFDKISFTTDFVDCATEHPDPKSTMRLRIMDATLDRFKAIKRVEVTVDVQQGQIKNIRSSNGLSKPR